jgi:hypothetical protein
MSVVASSIEAVAGIAKRIERALRMSERIGLRNNDKGHRRGDREAISAQTRAQGADTNAYIKNRFTLPQWQRSD